MVLKKYFGFFLGLIILLIGSGFIVIYNFYLDDKMNSEHVVVAVKSIPFKTEITADMVELQIRKVHYVVPGAFKKMEDVIGQQSSIHLEPNTQLYSDLVDPYNVIPGADEEIFPIPEKWIYAKPGSLRRTFKVNIGVIREEASVESHHQISKEELSKLSKPVLENVVVAYAKDSSNKEVVGTNDKDKRLDASGNITNLDVVLKREQYQLLVRGYIEKGYQLILSYN
ncbi:MAG TPA: SAF domain-containing protein [Bacilli bacterium]